MHFRGSWLSCRPSGKHVAFRSSRNELIPGKVTSGGTSPTTCGEAAIMMTRAKSIRGPSVSSVVSAAIKPIWISKMPRQGCSRRWSTGETSSCWRTQCECQLELVAPMDLGAVCFCLRARRQPPWPGDRSGMVSDRCRLGRTRLAARFAHLFLHICLP